MSEKENPWFSPDRPAALLPAPTTAGSPPPLPDPPDPPLPIDHFPSLQSTIVSPPLTKKQISRALGTASSVQAGTNSETTCASPLAQDLPFIPDCPNLAESGHSLTAPASPVDPFQGYTVHIPKNSIPFPPSTTSSSNTHNHPAKSNHSTQKSTVSKTNRILLPPRPTVKSQTTPSQNQENLRPPPQSYAQKAKTNTNKVLQRLAPLSYSDAGIPQVTIPDEVFKRGAELHRDFIQGFFFAKMPSYQALQSVLNFMWGKGSKLDIRTNPKARSFLVRISNDYIRAKVLEKRIWYVGTAMFQVSSWNTSVAESIPISVPTSIPLWAYLKGLPLDLRSLEGLSFAAGLIGEPKETDEFTKNLTDLDLAHVKIEADLSKPLPVLIELRRTNGEIIPVEVSYPWIPPTCSHCRELGHIMKDCLSANPTWVEKHNNSAKQDPVPKTAKETTPKDTEDVTAVETNLHADPKPASELNEEEPVTETNYPMDEIPEDQQTFENDLLEILSPDHTTIPDSSLPASSTLVFSFKANPESASLAIQTKNPPPLKLKSSLKRPPSNSPPSLTLFNPFSLLDATQNKATKLSESSDPSNLSKFSFSAFSPSPPKLPASLHTPLNLTADEPLDPHEEASLQSQ
ncbi:hypothetical protein BRARA_C03944 [Brassica rapa]|uniref:DUF4283 domain-containing protein n=1 Tax=Brassica campestris TaxID=3711 RepID=A0A398A9X2_BRACM|nr:hypothetical protein BRARA_C03944 [Brassica rapa]